MAVQTGGITGRLKGKLGGVVFSSARGYQGKLNTVREKVSPSNPNTAAQQSQRSKFSTIVNWVQGWTPALYQTDWNRAVGQLPGWQSLQKLGLDAIDASLVFGAIPVIPLGTLHQPDTFDVGNGIAAGEFALDLTAENGQNGTAADELIVVVYPTDWSAGGSVAINTSYTRSQLASLTALDPGFGNGVQVQVCLYMRGAGNAEGLLSNASFGIVTTGS